MSFLQLLASIYLTFAPGQLYAGPPAVLYSIAQCESGQRHTVKGELVVSHTDDVGYFQINRQHTQTAERLGYDIETEEGNIAFAVYLYQKNGTRDWNASKHCWGKPAIPAAVEAAEERA